MIHPIRGFMNVAGCLNCRRAGVTVRGKLWAQTERMRKGVHNMLRLDDDLQDEIRETVAAFLKARTAVEFSALLGVEHDIAQQAVYETLAAIHNDGFERGKENMLREYR
jgi:hypothetical protein